MLDYNDILRALSFAEEAHRGQVRKYTSEPYFTHCVNVAKTVSMAKLPPRWESIRVTMVVASLLHDVVEDTHRTLECVREEFGVGVQLYVKALTDVPLSEGNREVRKAKDRTRLSLCGDGVKIIKCADVLDNLPSIMEHDDRFAPVFLEEVNDLIPHIKPSFPSDLWESLNHEVQQRRAQ
jgi:(p)ppGpp synthase/HD superfamily hydrolase